MVAVCVSYGGMIFTPAGGVAGDLLARRNVSFGGVLAQLQRTDVGGNRPAIGRGTCSA